MKNYQEILQNVTKISKNSIIGADKPRIMAVSKGQPVGKIEELLTLGHRLFGENKVQEAKEKWSELKKTYSDIELHLIGHLQSNKARDAIALFDVIQTVDREKIAVCLSDEMKRRGRNLACYIQVNIGDEPQKHGISTGELGEFTNFCRYDVGLEIVGYMCIPPKGESAAPYFALMRKLAMENDIEKLSMGMSADYETAIKFGSSCIRVGTALFGERHY